MRAYGCSMRRSMPGFTLVELIVVVAIIGILSTVVIVRYAGKTDEARVAASRAQIRQLENVIIEFQADCGRLPQSLDELVNKPSDCAKWKENGYLRGKTVARDPWGRDYIYRADGGNYEIICLGADGKQGGSGVNRDLSSEDLDGNKQ